MTLMTLSSKLMVLGVEDVENVLREMEEDIALAPEIYGKLDIDRIVNRSVDLAYLEIWSQIWDKELISK